MDTQKRLKVALYCRVAKDEQAEPNAQAKQQRQLAAELLQQFLQEQEVPSCRKCRLSSR